MDQYNSKNQKQRLNVLCCFPNCFRYIYIRNVAKWKPCGNYMMLMVDLKQSIGLRSAGLLTSLVPEVVWLCVWQRDHRSFDSRADPLDKEVVFDWFHCRFITSVMAARGDDMSPDCVTLFWEHAVSWLLVATADCKRFRFSKTTTKTTTSPGKAGIPSRCLKGRFSFFTLKNIKEHYWPLCAFYIFTSKS